MGHLRAILMQRRQLALVCIALAIALRAIVPAGYMIGSDAKVLTIAVCHDASGAGISRDVVVPMKSDSGVPGKPAKGECPYGALAMAGLGGADVVLLALALAFVIALGFAPQTIPQASRPAFLRPPLRGPPALS
ncbi:DUF2946 family protein [Novosphingobium aquimarinum]|uniref:DUF2946 family protein n=1 Tax=Novosphingobium aquimarinum TaxID=2682494 RepID=UPI0012EBE1E4|nr:DUF2946 family protein [Novosphingobium aquimarinum]